jgi:transcriptional regulator with XRE-family HTH domain
VEIHQEVNPDETNQAPHPIRLAEKLLQIRLALGLSQNEMLRQLGLSEGYIRSTISGYERGEREPPLPVLLRYAEVANVYVDALIDDRLGLPARLPARRKHAGVSPHTS